jgi:predicted transcriptional regulator
MIKETSVSVRVDENMKKVLEALAHGQRRTLSSYLSIVLEKHVAEQPKETILQAIANRQEQLERENKIIEQVTLTTNLTTVPLHDLVRPRSQPTKKK